MTHSDRRDQETGSMPLRVKDETVSKRPITSEKQPWIVAGDLVDLMLEAAARVPIP
jgi:hypothetical protein